ncbi:hypothetical protein KI688_010716 [Linnemannia hyalina]|uniref:Alcohol acetyltransferase n=1 Tax=Linnemannia hyalina TaxID=64524 RepID=A0A9P7XWK9_9FUNG|nr:hypothetical protein KI688_010716 [Linnemannia hyalina]
MVLQVVRPVDNLERYNVTRSNVNIYNNVSVGISVHSPVTLPSHQRDWAQLLLNPITTLLERHPILATVVGDHLTGHPVFLRLQSVDLLPLIQVYTASFDCNEDNMTTIAQVLEDEHNKPFNLADQARPLWRLTFVPIGDESFCLIYTFHHVIGDGRSAMALTEQLVEQLNLQLQSATPSPSPSPSPSPASSFKIPIVPDKPIPASIESRINCYPSIRSLLWEASRAIFLPGFIKKALETKYWAGEIDSSLEVPNQTEVGFLRLTQDETQAVVRVAKTRATTVQAILYTASIFAVRSVFMSGSTMDEKLEGCAAVERNDEEALVFATPCSLRELIPNRIGANEQGNYVSEILHDNIQVKDRSGFWAMTDAYRKEVVAGTTTPRGIQDLLEHFGALALLSKKDGSWEKFMTSKVTKDQHGRKASVKLSNLGRGWSTPSTSGTVATGGALYTIQDVVFSQSSGVTASALTMSAATANSRLSISTTWQKAAFHGRARGEMFVAEFKRILLLVALQHADTPELSYLDICPRH